MFYPEDCFDPRDARSAEMRIMNKDAVRIDNCVIDTARARAACDVKFGEDYLIIQHVLIVVVVEEFPSQPENPFSDAIKPILIITSEHSLKIKNHPKWDFDK
jgi:hypothetical protein